MHLLIACLVVLAASPATARSAPSIRGRVVADDNDLALARLRVVVSVDGPQAEARLTDVRGDFVL